MTRIFCVHLSFGIGHYLWGRDLRAEYLQSLRAKLSRRGATGRRGQGPAAAELFADEAVVGAAAFLNSVHPGEITLLAVDAHLGAAGAFVE